MFEKDTSRAERRHHTARLKNTRKRYWGRHPVGENPGSNYTLEWDEGSLGAVTQTPCVCSCHMCGNARKYYGNRTFQEIREMQEPLAQLLSDC